MITTQQLDQYLNGCIKINKISGDIGIFSGSFLLVNWDKIELRFIIPNTDKYWVETYSREYLLFQGLSNFLAMIMIDMPLAKTKLFKLAYL